MLAACGVVVFIFLFPCIFIAVYSERYLYSMKFSMELTKTTYLLQMVDDMNRLVMVFNQVWEQNRASCHKISVKLLSALKQKYKPSR